MEENLRNIIIAYVIVNDSTKKKMNFWEQHVHVPKG